MSLPLPPEPGSADVVAAPPFTVSVDLSSGWISAGGELDRGNAHHLLDALGALAGTRLPHWTLDARAISFCDAEGLRSLVVAHRVALHHGRTLAVLPSACMHRLVLLVGLDQLLATPPPTASVRTGVTECVRTRRALAAIPDVRRPTSVPRSVGTPG